MQSSSSDIFCVLGLGLHTDVQKEFLQYHSITVLFIIHIHQHKHSVVPVQ